MKEILNFKKKCVYIYIYIYIYLLADTDIYRLKLNFTGGKCKPCSASTMEVYNKGTGEY